MTERQVLVLNADTISWSPTAIMTKEILLGQKVGSMCCEGINISSNFYSNEGRPLKVCCSITANETRLPWTTSTCLTVPCHPMT